jgi:small-conductance mechanosensitive channel
LTHSGHGLLAGQPAPDKARPVEVKKTELYQLTNEELVKQADAIWEKMSRDYLAQLRGLATAQALLDDVRKQSAMVKGVAPAPAEDPIKKAVDAAKTKQDVITRKLKLVQAQKDLLGRVATGVEGCRSTTVAFQNTLDDLKAYVLEAGLRVKDGSLAESKLPRELKPEFLEKKKEELLAELVRLKAGTADAQKEQEALAKVLDEVNKAALTADAEVVEASKNLVREQKRQELEKTYAGKNTDEMQAELVRMIDEAIGLKGTYELALRRFDGQAKSAARLRSALDNLKPPAAKVPNLARAEDVETAARSIQELVGFYTARGKKIEELRTDLAALAREGGEFEADATVAEEHLFKMQMLAHLLKKHGIADAQLPERARTASLEPAAVRQKESASKVRAATEKAKTELAVLDRQLTDVRAASEAAVKQLANLKESQEVTLAALHWEGQLKDMTATQVVEAFTATRKELADRLGTLKGEADKYSKATAAVDEATARLEGLKDPFIRAAEEQGQAERQKLIGELRKEAGLERAATDAPPAKSTGDPKKQDSAGKPVADTRPELKKASDQLSTFQQLLAGRVRVLDERATKTKDLRAALDDLEQAAVAYSKTLAAARLLALRLSATAVDLKKRVGKGDLEGDAIPEGVTDALRLETRTQLDTTATSVLNAIDRLQQNRDKLLRPDPEGETLATATKELLMVVGRRLDLLSDQKRVEEEYRREKSARAPSELKRLERLAAERRREEGSGWDMLLGMDSSKAAKDLSELLETYYRELIEIEEKEDNLKKQRDLVNKLLELAQQETGALARVRPLLAKQLLAFQAAREEETVLARARLRPDQADELLKAYQTKTGRLLAKPLPVPDKDRAQKVDALGNAIFERYVLAEAAKKWDDALSARASPTGVGVEAGVLQDELTKINATAAANVRRVKTLTGAETPRPAASGEIGKTREELATVRSRGVKMIGVKIGSILVGVFLVPWLLMAILRRATGTARGDNSSLVLSAVGAVVKILAWVVGLAMILSTLGFDVTAIIAGLGISGLAIGLAAQPMIADAIAALVIVAERRFKIGDVIRLGATDPARVIGLRWRSTQLRNPDGLVVTIPNRRVIEATTQNLTKGSSTYDSLNVSVTTQKDVSQVLAAIESAMTACEHLASNGGTSVREFNQKGDTKTIKYRFWWFLKDYDSRSKTRDEIFARIAASLTHADLAGTEISLA